jgi:hypothetical protein
MAKPRLLIRNFGYYCLSIFMTFGMGCSRFISLQENDFVTGKICGKTIDFQGNILSKCIIELNIKCGNQCYFGYSPNKMLPIKYCVSDDNGIFRFDSLEAGTYSLLASNESLFCYMDAQLKGTGDSIGELNIEMAMSLPGSLTGFAGNKMDTSSGEAFVCIERINRCVKIDEQSRFRFENIPEGTYNLAIYNDYMLYRSSSLDSIECKILSNEQTQIGFSWKNLEVKPIFGLIGELWKTMSASMLIISFPDSSQKIYTSMVNSGNLTLKMDSILINDFSLKDSICIELFYFDSLGELILSGAKRMQADLDTGNTLRISIEMLKTVLDKRLFLQSIIEPKKVIAIDVRR